MSADTAPLAADSSSAMLPATPALGAAVAALLLLGTAVVLAARLGRPHLLLAAGGRAALQLLAVSAVVGWVAARLPAAFGFTVLMSMVAARTAGRRITDGPSWPWAALPIVGATAPVLGALLATGVVPATGLTVVAVAGILTGGALTATALAGRRALDELAARRGEVDAALALGLAPREARLLVCREAAAGALIPALDQTRTVGLVTLPGAFVGMLLGGASPVEAGAVQLFVLVGLLAVEAAAVAVVLELVACERLYRSRT